MKKIILLIGFLFFTVISFSNPISNNSMLENSASSLVEMDNLSVNNEVYLTQPYTKSGKAEISNVNIKILNATCSITMSGRIGYGSAYLDVSITVSAATCDEAIAKAVHALHQLARVLAH